MSPNNGLEWLRAFELRMLRKQIEVRATVAPTSEDKHARLRGVAAAKLEGGSHLTREEFAAHLGVSTRMLQRMEGRGEVRRCPGLGSVVRYAASDVLRLASAKRKEG
jgi:hypothetical protein